MSDSCYRGASPADVEQPQRIGPTCLDKDIEAGDEPLFSCRVPEDVVVVGEAAADDPPEAKGNACEDTQL